MENNQVLQEMYSIRAVMSVMSNEKDKIEELDENIKERESHQKLVNENKRKGVKLCKYRYGRKIIEERIQDSEIERRISALIDERKNENTKISSDIKDKTILSSKYSSNHSEGFVFGLIITLILFLASLGGTIAFFHFSKVFWGVVFVIISIVLLMSVVGAIIGENDYKNEKRKAEIEIKILEGIEKIDQEINKLEMEKLSDEEILANKKAEEERKQKLEEQCKDEIEKIEEENKIFNFNITSDINRKKDTKKQLIKNSKTLYENAVQKYSAVLDERDWKHLDLVIYYLETGRAETIKEALILVDNQINANTIVNAIHNIGNQISETIIKSSESIARTMRKGFMELSQEIETLNKNNLMSSQEQNQLLRDLISETNLQNQLQKKANQTSQELANDIAYIKLREEYRAMKS